MKVDKDLIQAVVNAYDDQLYWSQFKRAPEIGDYCSTPESRDAILNLIGYDPKLKKTGNQEI